MGQKLYSIIRQYYKKFPGYFAITHHRGALNKIMNSLEKIKHSLKYNADIIEVDVSFRPDLIPVIIHKEHPYKNEGILFEKVINFVSSNSKCRMNIDLKNVANLPEIDNIIKKYNMIPKVIYTGVTENLIEFVKKIQ